VQHERSRNGQTHRQFRFIRSESAYTLPPLLEWERATTFAEDATMIQPMRLLAVFVAVTAMSGCATIAGGLIGTGVGVATGHPVSGALIGTGVGIMIDTAPRQSAETAPGRMPPDR